MIQVTHRNFPGERNTIRTDQIFQESFLKIFLRTDSIFQETIPPRTDISKIASSDAFVLSCHLKLDERFYPHIRINTFR